MNELFILDFGSGNTCKNDPAYVRRMIEEFVEAIPQESLNKCVIKWQLFTAAGDNIPLFTDVFKEAAKLANDLGIGTTASVFDAVSTHFFLNCEFNQDIPFVKIAATCRDALPQIFSAMQYNDMGDIPLLYSVRTPPITDNTMACVSRYPANIDDYESIFSANDLHYGISDHTVDWTLFKKYEPQIYECHYKLEDSTGLDAGPFARTPKQLKELFDELV